MTFHTLCVLVSSISFLAYVASYFISPHMKNEFKRFELEKIGLLTIVLEFIGAIGLLIGLKYNLILILSSLGLTLLMMSGLIVRIKFKDSLFISIPAIFFMLLNLYILLGSIN
jgi:hypothetical protein